MSEWDKYTGFWLGDEEDRATLAMTSAPLPEFMFAAPEEIDPRKLFPSHRWTENQGSQGACGGHANSNLVELCLGIATQAEPVHLSRQMAYISAQKVSGISGDRGSTIHGNVKVASERGLCEEALWPYTGRYVTNPPASTWDEVWANASKYRIAKHAVLRSYDEVFNWIASGTGGVNSGIRWGVPDAPVCESYRNSGGGHAIALMGYTKRKDTAGRNYILLLNSWGTGWGDNGWCEVAPKAIDQMLESSYTVMIGMTDMVNIVPRPVDFTLKRKRK